MQYDMVMPKMGESITEGTIIKWIKQVGDTVDKDEIILEISTDKVDSEIPTPVAGKISELLFGEGDVVEVGKTIAKIETDAESDTSKTPESKEPEPAPQTKIESEKPAPAKTAAPIEEKIKTQPGGQARFFTPVVLNIARAEGITNEELDSLNGTGINGRVTKKDVLNYLESRHSAHPVSTPAPIPAVAGSDGTEIVPMDHIRKKIAEHMVHTVHTSPHVGLFTEVDMSNVVRIRERNKTLFQNREGIKLTYMPFISEAVVKALKEMPYVNSSIDGDNIIVKHNVHLGIAVATQQGLIVPVIKNAENLNLTGMSRAINDIANRARIKRLKPDEVSGGTFSISNFGVYGTSIGFPLINQPQLAILGIGALEKRAVVVNDAIAIRPMMNISISFDHRLIDGELGAKFLQRVQQLLTGYDPDLKF